MAKPEVMSLDQWKSATDLGSKMVFFHQDRKKLAEIDACLGLYHSMKSQGAYFEVQYGLLTLTACRAWLQIKGSKISDNNQKRKTAVQKLMKQMYRLVKYLRDPSWAAQWDAFDVRKKAGVVLPAADRAELKGVFALEGAKPKGEARIGATMMGKALGINTRNEIVYALERKVGNKDLDELSPQEYLEVEQLLMQYRGQSITNSQGESLLTIKELNYYSKNERTQFLLVPKQNRFYGGDGNLFSTRQAPNKMMIYAVDEYGNFYAGIGEGGVTNHSSFNRGKGVICAGEIQAHNGVPYFLSNGSGHYKPNTQHLRAAVRLISLQYAIPVQQMWVFDRFANKCYSDGTAFLRNSPMPAPPATFSHGNPTMP